MSRRNKQHDRFSVRGFCGRVASFFRTFWSGTLLPATESDFLNNLKSIWRCTAFIFEIKTDRQSDRVVVRHPKAQITVCFEQNYAAPWHKTPVQLQPWQKNNLWTHPPHLWGATTAHSNPCLSRQPLKATQIPVCPVSLWGRGGGERSPRRQSPVLWNYGSAQPCVFYSTVRVSPAALILRPQLRCWQLFQKRALLLSPPSSRLVPRRRTTITKNVKSLVNSCQS